MLESIFNFLNNLLDKILLAFSVGLNVKQKEEKEDLKEKVKILLEVRDIQTELDSSSIVSVDSRLHK